MLLNSFSLRSYSLLQFSFLSLSLGPILCHLCFTIITLRVCCGSREKFVKDVTLLQSFVNESSLLFFLMFEPIFDLGLKLSQLFGQL